MPHSATQALEAVATRSQRGVRRSRLSAKEGSFQQKTRARKGLGRVYLRENLEKNIEQVKIMRMHFRSKSIKYEDIYPDGKNENDTTKSADIKKENLARNEKSNLSEKSINFFDDNGGPGSKYPVYCYYLPSGIDHKLDEKIIEMLKEWAQEQEENIFVGIFDIKSSSFQKLVKRLHFRQPAIIIMDRKWFTKDTLHFSFYGFSQMKSEYLKEVLAYLYSLMILSETKNKIRSILHLKTVVVGFKCSAFVFNLLRHVKLNFGVGGSSLSTQ